MNFCGRHQVDRPDFGLSETFLLEGLQHARVRYYYTFMIDAAVIFGADRKHAERELHDVLEFETNLAKVFITCKIKINKFILFDCIKRNCRINSRFHCLLRSVEIYRSHLMYST